MKKVISLALVLVLAVFAGCGKKAAGKTIYILGPTPDHGWTAQAGAYDYLEQKLADIVAAAKGNGKLYIYSI